MTSSPATESALKACPLCSCPHVNVARNLKGDVTQAFCKSCDCSAPIAAWNRRPPVASPAGRGERNNGLAAGAAPLLAGQAPSPASGAARFRNKRAVVEAMEFTQGNRAEVMAWCGATKDALSFRRSVLGFCVPIYGVGKAFNIAMVDDWIVKLGDGDFYPCRPDVFSATYEALAGKTAAQQSEGEANQISSSIRSEGLEKKI